MVYKHTAWDAFLFKCWVLVLCVRRAAETSEKRYRDLRLFLLWLFFLEITYLHLTCLLALCEVVLIISNVVLSPSLIVIAVLEEF